MKKNELIKHWINSSDNDFKTMEHLFKSKDYQWALFIGHLLIEKLLKAYYIKKVDENFPRTHNLIRIIEDAGVSLDDKKIDFLSDLTTFNIRARYEDYKNSFRRKCTKKFTAQYIMQIKEFRKWIKKEIES